ncbi:MAG: endonuclease/exonuclease/phosphatase family protein [Fidelibacterota bacterium]
MKKMVLTFLYPLLLFAGDTLTVAFWNVENLFDLEDDPRKSDEEFALGGSKGVTEEIYNLKLTHCAEVLSDLNADVVGLCEVENRLVLEELNQTFTGKNYSIIHYDSPDNRGIDCALLYDPRLMSVLDSKPIKNRLTSGKSTRDILYVKGLFSGKILHLFVNHWPSNYGGKAQAIPKRAETAALLRKHVEDLLSTNPDAEIVIMGDLNEGPLDNNVQSLLSPDNENSTFRLQNLMITFNNKPHMGTYVWRGMDEILDQIIISQGLTLEEGLFVIDNSITILDAPKYRQQSGAYQHYPFRFWAGDKLLGGYSDHLAIKVSIAAP